LLARSRFETFGDIQREQCPFGDERLLEAAAAGFLPLAADDDLKLVVWMALRLIGALTDWRHGAAACGRT
jgi:hypothetical protein